MDYFVGRGKWDKVLDLSMELSPREYNIFVNHNINLALFNTGQLGDRMFEYPQNLTSLLLVHTKKMTDKNVFLKRERLFKIFLKREKLFLELGSINIAERHCYEILETTGDNPFIIEQLAIINLAKGQIDTARVYLNRLRKNLIYGGHAREILRQIDEDPAMTGNDRIQRLRSIMLTNDMTRLGFDVEQRLNSLLERNRNNRMAFEYMMAYYLLTLQVDKLAANIERLDDFGYTRLPRHYEEALVLYMGPEGEKIDFPEQWKPSAEAWERAKEFDAIYTKYEHDRQLAMETLAEKFGRSFYFYKVFLKSGMKK